MTIHHQGLAKEDKFLALTREDSYQNAKSQRKTRTVRGSDYSPAIELSEQKDKLVTATGDTEKYSKINQRTNGPVNAHLISWPSKAQNIQNLENIW